MVMAVMHGDLHLAIAALDRGTSTSCHREHSFELLVALDIRLQIAEAMQYLHLKKITYSDLKSANMRINLAQIPEIAEAGYMDVKVADFGTSKIINATTTISLQTLMIRTTRRMAPEVMSEAGKDSSKMKYYPLKSDVLHRKIEVCRKASDM
jgi:serine/threonine protein kinase